MIYTNQDKMLQNMLAEYVDVIERVSSYYNNNLDKDDPDDFASMLGRVQLATLLGQEIYRRIETIGFINDLMEEDE